MHSLTTVEEVQFSQNSTGACQTSQCYNNWTNSSTKCSSIQVKWKVDFESRSVHSGETPASFLNLIAAYNSLQDLHVYITTWNYCVGISPITALEFHQSLCWWNYCVGTSPESSSSSTNFDFFGIRLITSSEEKKMERNVCQVMNFNFGRQLSDLFYWSIQIWNKFSEDY